MTMAQQMLHIHMPGLYIIGECKSNTTTVSDVQHSCHCGRGYKTTPKWGIKPPPTPFLAIFDPWGGFMPPGGGFIPPFAGVGLSPHRGGFIPRFGHWGGFITPLGWFYPPFLVILSPYWPGGGGGVGRSQCEPGNSVPEDRQTHSALFSLLCFRLFCFALLCTTPPPPVPRNRLVQEPPPGSAVECSHNFFYQWILGFPWLWWM